MRRLLDKILRFVQKVYFAALATHARRFQGRRRNEEAAKNEGYERDNEENQIKRKNGRWKPMVGC